MTVRTDIVVDHELSPRIADITSSSVELTVQDSHDTLADIEDTPEGGQYKYLVKTSGKEDIGGGVLVGLTTVLNDVQYAFQSPSPRSTGTVTNADATGITLEDSTATFETDSVQRGDWVINFTDQSVTEVLSVTSQTILVTRGLRNGTDNQFDSSDAYKVWEVKEVSLSGGNFTALDSVEATINPLFTTFGNFATRTASSSATLQNVEQLEASSFIAKEGLAVTIDALNISGSAIDSSTYPAGTREVPCLTEQNVADIYNARGFRNVAIVSNIALTSTYPSGHTFFGDNPQTVIVTLSPAGSFPGCRFKDCFIVGQFTSGNILWESVVGPITNANGLVYSCALVGPIVISDNVSIEQCWAAPGAITPAVTIDFDSKEKEVSINSWDGGQVLVKNMVTNSVFNMQSAGGIVTLDSSCTGGTVWISGGVEVIDNSTVDTIDNNSIYEAAVKASKALTTGQFIALKD